MKLRTFVVVLLSVLPWASAAQAQFLSRLANPTIDVTIEHPPDLNIQADTIVFGQADGLCANEIAQALVDEFLDAGLDVVDRDHLDGILAEHDLAARGLSDPSTMVAVGELIGPSALVSVREARCASKQETSEGKRTKYEDRQVTEKDDEGNEKTKSVRVPVSVTTRIARTSVDLRVSVRVVDLTTGRVFAGRSFAASPTLANSLDLEYSWEVGVAHAVRGDYEPALENLRQAALLRPGTIVDEAIRETRAAQSAREAIEKFNQETESLAEARELFLAERTEAEQELSEAVATSALTNEDIVEMAKVGLPDAVIVARIENARTAFSIGTGDLKALSDAGVSETIVVAMISAGSRVDP